jgi:hypothetical protein
MKKFKNKSLVYIFKIIKFVNNIQSKTVRENKKINKK